MLNWEKCYFMVQQGIILGHIISKQDIEVDKAKVELIVKLFMGYLTLVDNLGSYVGLGIPLL